MNSQHKTLDIVLIICHALQTPDSRAQKPYVSYASQFSRITKGNLENKSVSGEQHSIHIPLKAAFQKLSRLFLISFISCFQNGRYKEINISSLFSKRHQHWRQEMKNYYLGVYTWQWTNEYQTTHYIPGVSITLITCPSLSTVLWSSVVVVTPDELALDVKAFLPRMLFPVALFPLPVRPTKTRVLVALDIEKIEVMMDASVKRASVKYAYETRVTCWQSDTDPWK